MLRIFGHRVAACDRVSRRELLRAGGLSLFGGLTLTRLTELRSHAGMHHPPRIRSVVLLNLFGGPSHLDMFDLKTDAPAEIRGEFKPIDTSLPGYPTDHPVTPGDIVATIYQLLGVDPRLRVSDLEGRPVHVAHGGEPLWGILA